MQSFLLPYYRFRIVVTPTTSRSKSPDDVATACYVGTYGLHSCIIRIVWVTT